MTSPKENGKSKKFSSHHSPGMAVRKIPSSFDSAAIFSGKYVIEGAAQRISNTRIPSNEPEPKLKERKRLQRNSDQPTVMIMAMPDGFIDIHDEKTKNAMKSKIVKPPIASKVNASAVNNAKTASQKEKLRRQLDQWAAQQVTLTCKQLIPSEATKPEYTTKNGDNTLETDVSPNEASPASTPFFGKNIFNRRGSKSKKSCCCCIF